MTLLIIILILALLWVLAVQGRSSHPGMKALQGWNYAHRGLHGDGATENSMTAFRRAVENGYGMEFDLHLLKDGNLGVMHDSLLNRTTGQAGRIDVLINNAGFGIAGAVEFTDTAEAQRLLDVNFFGMVRMNKAVIPHMRQAGRGRIVNLSSVAAPCPIPFQAYYSAGKAAVNAYTMALANELRPFGITVCAVQPGDIHTGFTAARVKTMAGDDVYQGRIGRSVQRMEHDEQNGMDPAKAGAFIARVAMKRRPKPIYTIRLDYQFFVFLTRILPGRTLNWLIGLLYAR